MFANVTAVFVKQSCKAQAVWHIDVIRSKCIVICTLAVELESVSIFSLVLASLRFDVVGGVFTLAVIASSLSPSYCLPLLRCYMNTNAVVGRLFKFVGLISSLA